MRKNFNIKAIWDSIVYVKKLKIVYQLRLYYFAF